MANSSDTGGIVILHSALTAFVASLPTEAVGFFWKILSVFVLAMVAEAGRRIVGRVLKK